MAADRSSQASLVAFAVLLIGLSGIAWRWHQHVFQTPRPAVADQPWEQVKTTYPPTVGAPIEPAIVPAIVQAVVAANPFAAMRRTLPMDSTPGGATPATATTPPVPQFVFKGRINMGTRQRAILEDSAAKKTYFLEVGQEVAGFKVLDITESQVILSDVENHKELVVSLAVPTPPQPTQPPKP